VKIIPYLWVLVAAMACWIASGYVAQGRFDVKGTCDESLVGGPGALVFDTLTGEVFCSPFPGKSHGNGVPL
jgi:hypothetical protein